MEIRQAIRKSFRRVMSIFGERRSTPLILGFRGGTFKESMAMKLSTVYRCIDCISAAVAQLPLEIYRVDENGYKHKERNHPLAMMLNKKPNARMTRFTLLTLLIQSAHLEGNGYAYIKRDSSGMPEELIYLLPEYVTLVAPETITEPVAYDVTGIGRVEAKDMIHIVNKSFDGVTGLSTIYFASQTLGLSNNAEKHAAKFFANGCGIAGVLKSSNRLRDEQIKEIKEAWEKAYGSKSTGDGGIPVLPQDLDYRPVAVNPSDAQLLESRQFNVIDICRFFGVSPVKAFDLSKSSYSTVEATNISFLTDTISPLLEKIELELETKLFADDGAIDIRFDVSQLLRADKQSLGNYYRTLFNIGAISPNEIRRDIDLEPAEGGDKNYVQVNMAPLGEGNNSDINNAGQYGR